LLIVGNDFNKFDFDVDKNLNLFFDQINEQLNQLIILKKNNPKLEIIYFNFPKFNYLIDNYESTFKTDKKINYFNFNLEKNCIYNKIYLFNYYATICKVGQEEFYTQKNFFSSKSLISEKGNNYLSKEISKLVRSIFFVRKKCLILDLDNTLWGGILGEDGPNEIKVGNSYEGEKFKNFQKYVKKLSSLGVILAICSKNNLKDVEDCFDQNKNLFLKLKDFSIIKANWRPKYENINEIAKELNINKDSLVFMDDSKFEREQMKNFNPDVCVIETPKDPKDYIKAIDDTGFFYLNSNLTKEDLKKRNQYYIMKKADVLKKSSKNIDEYLKKLNMTLTISKVNNVNFTRCVQMLNKTNQFNFTTQRFTDATFKKYLENDKIKTMVISLKDKFGDHGITGLLTAKITKVSLILDNFLLSCRILGRKVEDCIIYEALNTAIKYKLKYLVGVYKKTTKNIQCENFYIRNGFIKKSNTQYILNTNNAKFKKLNFFNVIKTIK
jgi:FkbH-like protein